MDVKVNNRGYFDWLAQRVTALVLAVYFIGLLVFLCKHHSGAAAVFSWKSLLLAPWMKVITLIAMLSIIWHAWIGLWTVFTDYVKCRYIRAVLEVTVLLSMFGYLIWVIRIVWN